MLVAHPPKPKKLLEREVTGQIRDFLKLRGWRPIRMQRTVVPGQFQTGEPGMADFLFLRYLPGSCAKPAGDFLTERIAPCGLTLALWVEMKGQTDRRRCNCAARAMRGKRGKCSVCTQQDWRRKEESRGALFGPGHDFTAFERWYVQQFGWVHDGNLPGQMEMFFKGGS
jgi:hypothetical protein